MDAPAERGVRVAARMGWPSPEVAKAAGQADEECRRGHQKSCFGLAHYATSGRQ